MVASPPLMPPLVLTDDKRCSWQSKAVTYLKEAQDIYFVSSHDIHKAAFTYLSKQFFFEVLPKMFESTSANLKSEMQKNESLDSESYRESRILYDTAKPFFDKMGEIKTPSTISDEKELYLFESLVSFLDTVKEYIDYLDAQFLELDKPKFKSRLFTHVPESELWAVRNKTRSYIL